MSRYKIGDIDNERFLMLPKSFFTNPKYKPMTSTAKIIYAVLRDRMELSRKNGWADDNGDIYLLFTQENLAEYTGVNNSTAYRGMKELIKRGLIESVRQGLGKPNKIYINKPLITTEQSGGNEESRLCKMTNLDYAKMTNLDYAKCPSNDTEYNDTEYSETESKDERTDELSNLIMFCNNNVEILTPFKMQMLEGYVDDYGIEWVQRGLEKLAGLDRTKQNVKYLGGVLKGWKKDGVPKPWEDSNDGKREPKKLHDDVGEYELINGYKVYL